MEGMVMRKGITGFVLILGLALVSASRSATREVSITGGKFVPASVSIGRGESVQWSNDDDKDHWIEADDGSFASGKLKLGQTYEHKFSGNGAYVYHCKLHPREKGKVVVK